MNTEQINEWLEKLTQIETWVNSMGPGVITIVVYIGLGYVLKASFCKLPRSVSSVFLSCIPLLLIPVGIYCYGQIANAIDQDGGSSGFVYGLVFCLLGWIIHKVALTRTLDKLLFSKDDDGHTVTSKKPKNYQSQLGDSADE